MVNSLLIFFLSLFYTSTASSSDADKAQAIAVVKEAEKIRSLEKSEIDVELSTKSASKQITYLLRIMQSTERRALVDFLAPKEEKGRKLLALGQNYFATFPDSRNVKAVSRKELIGNSAFTFADIFQLDPDADYDPVIEAEEKTAEGTLLRLNLKAKHSGVAYDRIQYWVEKNGYFPVRSYFYGVSGKHLKTLKTISRKEIAGRLRPEVVEMVDEVEKEKISLWKTLQMKAADPPDHLFSKETLKKR